MSELRAGLIGCGAIGGVHSEAVVGLEGIRMAAFCDVVEEKARTLCARYGGDYATGDAGRVLSDDSLDTVYICTHHDTHADYCIRAAEAGKNVLVEKPLALTVEDCRRIGDAVEREGIRLFTAFKMRYYPMVQKARELIPEPLMVVMQMMDNRWGKTWANDPVLGGGNVYSQGCHSCDLLRYVAGSDPEEVYAAGGNYYQPNGRLDNLTATFRFESGSAGCWIQGDANQPVLTSKLFMEIFSENRSVLLTDRFCTLTYTETGKEPVVYRGEEGGFVEENRLFVEALQTGAPMAADHVDGLMATLMMIQAGRSVESRRPEPVASLARV